MGGQIRIIIREEDGTIHKQSRWTNTVPCFVKNIKFFTNDKDYINEYIKAYNKSGMYKSDNECISPNTEYGMVILDFKDKWIGSMNGYCGFDCYELSGILLSASNVVDKKGRIDLEKVEKVLSTEYNDFHSAYELYNAGILSFTNELYYADNSKSTVNIPISEFSEPEINRLYNARKSKSKSLFKSNKSVEFERVIGLIDYNKLGWSLTDYREDIKGNVAFLKDVLSHSFTLTLNDIDDWQSHINERFQEDDDDFNTTSNIIKSTIRELTLNKIV